MKNAIANDELPGPAARLQALPRRTYRFRVLGMGLGGIALGAALREVEGASWLSWAWIVFICFVWPHVAYVVATRSRDPFKAELTNFVLDSMFAASAVPLVHFNALPSIVLLTVVVADKVNSGIRDLWLRSLPGMALAIVVVGAMTGFAFEPETSMTVLLASLPILIIHTIAVSISSYRLVRRVQSQNVKLDELARRDALTGLDSRGHWTPQAEAMLARHQSGQGAATVALVDIDRFKEINDRYGHATGDDVLRSIAEAVRRVVPEGSAAGRLGGDEFAVAMPCGPEAALAAAGTLRAAVEALTFPRFPALRCSVSVGVAPAPGAGFDLREWLEAADRAMYDEKRTRRDRTPESAAR